MRGYVRVASVWFSLAAAAAAQDMPLSQVLLDGENWELVAEGFKFTEGPAVDGKGNLFFTDIPNNRIHKVDEAGRLSVFVEPSFATNGLMFGPDGRLYGCQNGMKRIVAFDAAGKPETIAEDVPSNDLVVTRQREIYCTDPDTKRVWHINAKGEKRVADEGIERPNGIILWPDQQTLVVTDVRNLWAFRIEADGSLKHKQPYYTLALLPRDTVASADGMTVDRLGRLFVCTRAGLQMFDPTGRLSGVIHKPQPAFLSNVTFGGPNLEYLYVTCSDKVFRRKTKTQGLLYFQPPGK